MSVPRPMRLTTWGVATADATEYVCVGPELTRQMVRRLDHVLAGQVMRDRLEDLHDDDPLAYEAYLLRQRGHKPAAIGLQLNCSLSTIRRALLRALATMGTQDDLIEPAELPYEERLQRLRQQAPAAYEVYQMAGYGWSLAAIAETRDISLSTAKRLSAKASTWMGERHRQADRERRRQRWLCWEAETDVPTEVIVARQHERDSATVNI